MGVVASRAMHLPLLDLEKKLHILLGISVGNVGGKSIVATKDQAGSSD